MPREFGGPSPEDMNFKSPDKQPEKQPEDSGKVETKEEPLLEFQSSDATKYKVGGLYNDGQTSGTIERIDYMHDIIFVRPEKQEQPEENREAGGELIELGSRDVTKYNVGEMFDNGEVKGIIRRIDYMRSTIAIEEKHDKEKK